MFSNIIIFNEGNYDILIALVDDKVIMGPM